MQQPGGDGRGGGNSRPMNGGFPFFPGFAGFPDPFAGFGGGPGSIFGSMFESNPFHNDPFFSHPFGNPFGSGLFGGGGMFTPGGPFGMGPGTFIEQGSLNGGFGHNDFFRQNNNVAPEVARRNVVIEDGSRRGVQIVELPDDHDEGVSGHQSSNPQPIIEQPDDDERPDAFDHSLRSASQLQPRSSGPSIDNPSRSYSYHSSSVMYGGSDGPYFASQSTRRQGSDGIVEEEHRAQDGRTGKAVHKHSRGIRDKGRSLTRKRNAEGREEKLEILHNLAEDEVDGFERNWEMMAKSLPKVNKSSSHRIGSSSRSRPALPPTSYNQ